jgi:hypothetical protein
MLQRLGDHISACLQRADQCKEAAALETDERVKTQLLEMERQWRHVAKSYEFIESLGRFLLDQQKNALPQAEESPSRDNLELSEPLRSAQ